jgi:hypothetical protein
MFETDPSAPRDEDNEDDRPDTKAERSESADRPPAAPADDDAPLGDTDQHSGAGA